MSEFDFEGVFDEDYLYFYEEMLTPERTAAEVEQVAELLGSREHVLDCPCGHGRIANALAERGYRVTGLDASELFLDRARADADARGVDVEYVHGDMRKLPWRETFDGLVNWFTSFGYFDDATNREMLVGFCDALRPGGRLVLETQNPDGSWFYALDHVRDFVDHFHTCFVLKALAKIYRLTRDQRIDEALEKGVEYYVCNLFDKDGLPKPFSRAPRLTVYKRELYDCAECINVCLLLRSRFPDLENILTNAIACILDEWVKSDGSFCSRQLHLGWDNVPMHRWGQSQMFRSLAYYLSETKKTEKLKAETHSEDGRQKTEDGGLRAKVATQAK